MDIVIPAVNNHHMGFTHLFTSREAKTNPFADVTFYDAVMASTSAPTYFPVHEI
jgi:patatin-like phospholipase/acyl hydrolase